MRRLPPLVLLLLIGSAFLAAMRFMAMPFLALYLHAITGASPPMVGLMVGLAAISNFGSGFILGPLSDRMGRKPSLVFGGILSGLAFIGFAFSHTLPEFAVCQVVAGMGWAIEGPAYMALLTDLTPQPMRVRVFGYQYWGINIGAGIGPLLGTLAGAGHSALPFLLDGLTAIVIAGVLFLILPKGVGAGPEAHRTAADSLRHMGEGLFHPVLFWFFLGVFLTGLTYVQVESNVAQFLGLHYADGARLFAYMISANAATVICLQPFLSRWQEKRPLVWGLAGGAAIYALTNAAFIWAHAPISWILINVVFTVGEILLAPGAQAVLARYAPEDKRATYFTLLTFQWSLSAFVGPVLGGFALLWGGKLALFGGMVFIDLLAIGAFVRGLGRDRATSPSVEVSAQA